MQALKRFTLLNFLPYNQTGFSGWKFWVIFYRIYLPVITYEAIRSWIIVFFVVMVQVGRGMKPAELLNPVVLHPLFNDALRSSLHGDSSHADNISFLIKYMPRAFNQNGNIFFISCQSTLFISLDVAVHLTKTIICSSLGSVVCSKIQVLITGAKNNCKLNVL